MRTCSIIALLSFAVAPLVSAQESAGEVARLRGTAQATSAEQTRPLTTGATVLVGDTIETEDRTRVEIRFLDGTLLKLGDNSRITVNQYVYDPDRSLGRLFLDLVTGVFRVISGADTVFQQDAFLVQTPVASIGIRGTDFWGRQSAAQLQVALLDESAIVISNGAGSVVLENALETTIVTSATEAPSPPFALTPEQLEAAAATVDF